MTANFFGKVITACVSIVLIPLYLCYLGPEAYGLVSFQVTLQVVFSFLEMGLPATITREMGRRDNYGETNYHANLVRTFECLIWGTAIGVAVTIVCISSVIAQKWLNIESLTLTSTVQALMLMGGMIAVQLPSLVYSGGLRGLEKQILLNGCAVVSAVVRGGGAILILTCVAPDIRLFIGWNLVVTCAETIFLRSRLYANLPHKESKPAFQLSILKRHWTFSSKIICYSLILSFASQVDKLTISKTLKVESLGYYAIAGTIANIMVVVASAIVMAVYPKICRMFKDTADEPAVQYYFQSVRLLGTIIWPMAFFIFFFSSEILSLWMRNTAVVEKTHWPLSILAIAIAFSAMAQLTNYLAIASDKMKFVMGGTLILTVLTAPLTITCVLSWGLTGAACAVMGLNLAYNTWILGMSHHYILHGRHSRWLWDAMLFPAFISFAAAATAHSLIPICGLYLFQLCRIGIAFIVCFVIVIFGKYVVADLVANGVARCLGRWEER